MSTEQIGLAILIGVLFYLGMMFLLGALAERRTKRRVVNSDPYEKYRPHTHTPALKERDLYMRTGLRVVYGDTSMPVKPSADVPTPEEVSEALQRAVEAHDKGTQEALEKAMAMDKARDVLQVFGKGRKGVWGSELLKK